MVPPSNIDPAQLTPVQLPFTATCVTAICLAFQGAGSIQLHTKGLAVSQYLKGCMWFVMVQIFYAVATAPIRSSIAAALLRFTSTNRTHTFVLRSIIVITCLTSVITIVGVVTQAHPLDSIWDAAHAKGPLSALEVHWFSYFIAVMSIILDLAIASMPILVLWETTLQRSVKVSLAALLALGALTCFATIAALVFLVLYSDEEGLNGRGALALCHVVELGVGMIAGSAAAIKPLFRRRRAEGPRYGSGSATGIRLKGVTTTIRT